MLKALLKKQFREMWQAFFYNRKKGTARSAGSTALYAVLYAFLLLTLFAMFFGLSTGLSPLLLPEVGLSGLYFSLVSLIAMLFGVFGSVFSTYSMLYLAKDNDALLSMPIPPSYLLFSRMVVVFFMGAIYVLPVWIPAMAVYAMTCGFSLIPFLCQLAVLFLLFVFVCFLSALLGFLVAIIASRLKNKSIIVALLSLGFIALYYVVYFKALKIFTSILEYSTAIDAFLVKRLPFVAWIGSASAGNGFSLLWLALVVLALFALTYFLLSKTLIRISIRSGGERRKVARADKARASSPASALLRKEWRRFFGSATYLLNCGLGVILVLLAVGAALVKRQDVLVVLNDGALSLFAPFLLYAIATLPLAMNAPAAPSISLEGNTLWQLKSLPIPTFTILSAKARMQMLLNLPFGILAAVSLGLALGLSPLDVVFVALANAAFLAFAAYFDLSAGLRHPMLDWTSEVYPVKQSGAVFVSTLVVPLFAIASAVPGAICTWYLPNFPTAVYFAGVAAAFFALAALSRHWLKTNGAKIFEGL